MFIYPDNLNASATLGIWKLSDVVIIGISALLSVLAFVLIKFHLPLVMTSVYAFLSIRYEDISIKDFLKYAFVYFTNQQYYKWGGDHN